MERTTNITYLEIFNSSLLVNIDPKENIIQVKNLSVYEYIIISIFILLLIFYSIFNPTTTTRLRV